MKILIVEDDDRIAVPIKEDLQNQHYLVDIAKDGECGLALSTASRYDLVLLDVMLPKLDGIELCQRLRQSGYTGPILMLTARASKADKIHGLDSGADDYLVKPFDIDELNAHIRALLRRGSETQASKLEHGPLVMDLTACSVSFENRPVELTPTEYRILMLFLRNPERIFNRVELFEKLWLLHETPTDAVVKAHIKGLRNKLQTAGAPRDIIETVHGFGYRLRANA